MPVTQTPPSLARELSSGRLTGQRPSTQRSLSSGHTTCPCTPPARRGPRPCAPGCGEVPSPHWCGPREDQGVPRLGSAWPGRATWPCRASGNDRGAQVRTTVPRPSAGRVPLRDAPCAPFPAGGVSGRSAGEAGGGGGDGGERLVAVRANPDRVGVAVRVRVWAAVPCGSPLGRVAAGCALLRVARESAGRSRRGSPAGRRTAGCPAGRPARWGGAGTRGRACDRAVRAEPVRRGTWAQCY